MTVTFPPTIDLGFVVGLAVLLVGVVAVAYPSAFQRWGATRLLRTLRLPLIFVGFVVVGSSFFVNTPETRLPNPVPATVDSIAAGNEVYLNSCSRCHGVDARGGGVDAGTTELRPPALAGPGSHLSQHTDGDLHYFITHRAAGRHARVGRRALRRAGVGHHQLPSFHPMSKPIDWQEWHTGYESDTPLRRRLEIVQRHIGEVLDSFEGSPLRVVSMCAGEGRDLLGALDGHTRRDITGRLVELDPELAERARAHAAALGLSELEVRVGDAGDAAAYAGAVPADLVLVCGVFGNISDADIEKTLKALPMFAAPDATVMWTRHRREPDMTVNIRRWLAEAGFENTAYDPVPNSDTTAADGGDRWRGTIPRSDAAAPRRAPFHVHSEVALADRSVDCSTGGDDLLAERRAGREARIVLGDVVVVGRAGM